MPKSRASQKTLRCARLWDDGDSKGGGGRSATFQCTARPNLCAEGVWGDFNSPTATGLYDANTTTRPGEEECENNKDGIHITFLAVGIIALPFTCN